MAGHWHGPVAAILRGSLATGEAGYRAGVQWRNQRYDQGIGVNSAGLPVVSVGNITAGGTGKTPVVAWVAKHFHRWGLRVALLSRGYRSSKREHGNVSVTGNDEAKVLARLCPGIPHRQQADRFAAAEYARSHWHSEVLVLDDGFQHRRLARDLDIVLVDATNPFGFEHLLPRGLLREPATALRRADVILLTRVDAVSPVSVARLRERLDAMAPDVPVAEVIFPARRLVNASGQELPLEALDETPVLAFCGIGNPAAFARTLSQAGLRAAECFPFPDHHHYRSRDIARLSDRAWARGVGAAVTTLKDLVKLNSDILPGPSRIPIWAVETDCQIVANESTLTNRLDALVTSTTQRQAA